MHSPDPAQVDPIAMRPDVECPTRMNEFCGDETGTGCHVQPSDDVQIAPFLAPLVEPGTDVLPTATNWDPSVVTSLTIAPPNVERSGITAHCATAVGVTAGVGTMLGVATVAGELEQPIAPSVSAM